MALIRDPEHTLAPSSSGLGHRPLPEPCKAWDGIPLRAQPESGHGKNMYYTYILKSEKKDRFYIGSTGNINNRLKKHNSGSVKSTKAYRPWKIVYLEEYETNTEARRRENEIKSWKNKKRIKKAFSRG